MYIAKDCGFVAKQKLSGYFVFSRSLAKIQGPARNIGLNCMYDLPNILTSNKWCAFSSFFKSMTFSGIRALSMLGFVISIRNTINGIFEI